MFYCTFLLVKIEFLENARGLLPGPPLIGRAVPPEVPDGYESRRPSPTPSAPPFVPDSSCSGQGPPPVHAPTNRSTGCHPSRDLVSGEELLPQQRDVTRSPPPAAVSPGLASVSSVVHGEVPKCYYVATYIILLVLINC